LRFFACEFRLERFGPKDELVVAEKEIEVVGILREEVGGLVPDILFLCWGESSDVKYGNQVVRIRRSCPADNRDRCSAKWDADTDKGLNTGKNRR
jgi:hypothetical protein